MKRRLYFFLPGCAFLILCATATAEMIEVKSSSTDVAVHPTRVNVERGFIGFELPAVLDSVYLDVAELIVVTSMEFDSTEPLLIGVAPATSAAARSSLTGQQEWRPEAMSELDPEYLFVLPVSELQERTEIRLDVTHIVRRWLSGESPNYGFVLRGLTEDKSTFHWIRDGRYNGSDAKLVVHYSRL